MAESIAVEVAYAGPQAQQVCRVSLPAGSTVADALAASGLMASLPAGTIDPDRLGIFSRKVSLQTPVGEGDRVEIYRPLTLDPKEARRRRASR